MAMGATEDSQLAKETLEYTSYHARDQDVIYFYSGLAANPKTRRMAVDYFMKNYDAVCTITVLFEGSLITSRLTNGLRRTSP